jgi:hypothetical protein
MLTLCTQAEKARQAEAERVAKEAAREAERVAKEAAKAAEAAEKARLKAEKEAQVRQPAPKAIPEGLLLEHHSGFLAGWRI